MNAAPPVAGSKTIGLAAPRTRICFTEMLVLLAFIPIGVVMVDPFFGGRMSIIGIFRYFPLVVLYAFLVLNWIGASLFHRYGSESKSALVKAAAPLLLLGIFIVAGSIYGMRIKKIENSFLSLGITLPLFGLFAHLFYVSPARERLMRGLTGVILLTSAAMGAMVYITWAKGALNSYHEEVFLAIPFVLYFFIAEGLHPAVRLIGAAFFFSLAVVTQKNTAHILGLVCVAAIAYFWWWPRIARIRSFERLVWAWFFCMAAVVLALFVWFLLANREHYLQHGNTEYRIHMYKLAMQRFYRSPLWGTGFSEPSVERFDLYTVATLTQTLPTHSDIIDILANGGLIGIAFWLAGNWIVFRQFLAARLSVPAESRGALHTLVLMYVSALVTYSFNPLLSKPPHSAFVWAILGAVLGYSMHHRRVGGGETSSTPSLSRPSAFRSARGLR